MLRTDAPPLDAPAEPALGGVAYARTTQRPATLYPWVLDLPGAQQQVLRLGIRSHDALSGKAMPPALPSYLRAQVFDDPAHRADPPSPPPLAEVRAYLERGGLNSFSFHFVHHLLQALYLVATRHPARDVRAVCRGLTHVFCDWLGLPAPPLRRRRVRRSLARSNHAPP